MPTPAKSWIMHLRLQKQTTVDKFDTVETLPAVHMAPLAVGPHLLVGIGSILGAHPYPMWLLRPEAQELGAIATGALPFLANIPDRVGKWWNVWATYSENWLLTAPQHDIWLVHAY